MTGPYARPTAIAVRGFFCACTPQNIGRQAYAPKTKTNEAAAAVAARKDRAVSDDLVAQANLWQSISRRLATTLATKPTSKSNIALSAAHFLS
jgi:hypothetical protein